MSISAGIEHTANRPETKEINTQITMANNAFNNMTGVAD